jgi:hypothetical protein
MTDLRKAAAGTPVTVFDDAEQLGEALAREILDGLTATAPGQRYLLGWQAPTTTLPGRPRSSTAVQSPGSCSTAVPLGWRRRPSLASLCA